MKQNIISSNTGEVAALPMLRIPLDLQLFAGEDEEVIDMESDDDAGTSEQEDDNFEAVDVRGQQEEEVDKEVIQLDPKNVEKEKQEKSTNDAFQKMRQEKEAAEKRADELENKRKRDIEVARKFGKEYNIYSDEDVAKQYGESHGLTTVEQFEQALEKEKYAKAGLPAELVDELMESRKERMERKQREEVEQKEKQERLITDGYNELAQAYPTLVKSPGDVSQEVWKAFNLGTSGLSLTEIFRAKNHDAIISQTAAATKQRTLNNLNSKKHLTTEGDGGADPSEDVTIDEETMDYYKGMGMNKAQATKHHKKLYG